MINIIINTSTIKAAVLIVLNAAHYYRWPQHCNRLSACSRANPDLIDLMILNREKTVGTEYPALAKMATALTHLGLIVSKMTEVWHARDPDNSRCGCCKNPPPVIAALSC